MPWVFGLVLKWHDNSELSHLGDASAQFLTEQNFRAGSWISEPKFAQRLAIKGKGRKHSCTERKTEECFQRSIGSCSRRDACSFLHMHATGDREDNVEWSADTQEIWPGASILFQCRKWRNRLTKQLEQSKGQSCDWSWTFLVYGGQDEKRSSRNCRHHPVCRGYKSGNRCIRGYRCLLSTSWW